MANNVSDENAPKLILEATQKIAKEKCPIKEECFERDIWIAGFVSGYIHRIIEEIIIKKLE